ncbi:alpha-1,2-mannosidase [Xanthomonas graminis]|uniref:alpha-1,2-mannosidase n=1 Tax=Xanthomonas graminis TaxID=3390026 RepID=UPI0025422E9A|nr:alpha-1,2-mannosidase [Xanthomonas translucens]
MPAWSMVTALPHPTLALPNGKRLRSVADGHDAPPCIGSASLNGRPLGRGRRVNAG